MTRGDASVRRLVGWRWRWQRILAIMRMESLQLWRDRPTLGLIALVPAVQMALFGGAVDLNPTNLSLAIATASDETAAAASRAAQASGYFRRIERHASVGAARAAAESGTADLGLELYPSTGSTTLYVDATDIAAVRPAVLALALELQRSRPQGQVGFPGLSAVEGVTADIAPTITWLYNEPALTTWSLTPGLVGVVMMISMLLLGALTLVREREQGQWESLLATAADGADALAGKLLPYVLLGVLQAAVVVGCAHVFFDVPVRGSMVALLSASLLFAGAHLLLGFALSALASTQLQAIQSAVFFYLPSMLLSGFMFPFQGMPRWAQWLGECLPLTHFVRIARAVMLRGHDPGAIVDELWPIALFAVLAATVALLCYRRQLR